MAAGRSMSARGMMTSSRAGSASGSQKNFWPPARSDPWVAAVTGASYLCDFSKLRKSAWILPLDRVGFGVEKATGKTNASSDHNLELRALHQARSVILSTTLYI